MDIFPVYSLVFFFVDSNKIFNDNFILETAWNHCISYCVFQAGRYSDYFLFWLYLVGFPPFVGTLIPIYTTIRSQEQKNGNNNKKKAIV